MSTHFQHLLLLVKKLGIAFLVYTICRLLFYSFNANHFTDVEFGAFFYGLRFDLMSISFLFAPVILLHIIPFPFRNNKGYLKAINFFFYVGIVLSIFLNMIDVVYFDFALKRSTADLFQIVKTGDDFLTLLPSYILDFWYAFLLFGLLIWFAAFLHKKYIPAHLPKAQYNPKAYGIHSLLFVFALALTVVGMRGGFQYMPLSIINAGQYVQAQNIPVVLNTPFTVLKTLETKSLEQRNYFDSATLNNIYTPEKTLATTGKFKGKNVVLIILESFAKEYVGALNNQQGYTPFIDSLLGHSLVFTNAFANGQRSIESLPSLLTGLPQLMSMPYVLSNYSSNTLDGIPKLLKNQGYNTSFYHSGKNGTMGFNGFVGATGIDEYYGFDEFPENEKLYDGHWGIFDEPYLQYFANELNNRKQPFFSSVFTISSHHPYVIPAQHQGKFPKGTLPLHESVGYTDYALKQFFATAQKMPWFKNTLFVFSADHSAPSVEPKHTSRMGRFAIPIFFFDPNETLKGRNDKYFQQIDVSATLAELTACTTTLTTFGNSAFSNTPRYVVNFVNNTYQITYKNCFLIFDGSNTIAVYDVETDPATTHNIIAEQPDSFKPIVAEAEILLKAIIQQYNNRLIHNQLSSSK